MDAEKIQEYLTLAGDSIITYAPKVAIAVIVLLIGIRVINKLVGLAVGRLKDSGIGTDLAPFLGSLVGVGLKILLFFVVAGVLGFDVASFVAILAAASFAVGLALQGSLSNFAAGIIIVIFRPYKVGDWIQIPDGFFGRVEEIQIFNTLLTTPGQKTLIVPNSEVVANVVTNYSQRGVIRLELTLLMAYEENFPRIKRIILDSLEELDLILHDPAPQVGIESFDTHNVIVAVRPFVAPDDYWEATFQVNESIKQALSRNGIRMAYSEGVELGAIGE